MTNPTTLAAEIELWSDSKHGVRRAWRRLSCLLFGHKVSNSIFSLLRGAAKQCNCGVPYLSHCEETRVSHTVSCFLAGHRYIRIAVRSGHNEYVCVRCGHPLLFRIDRDPYSTRTIFVKKVRYLCNLFGHRVHAVASRCDLHEYACDCGHSFLKAEAERREVKHPAVCLFAGHFLRFTERRGDYDEYFCRNCGHTFYFVS